MKRTRVYLWWAIGLAVLIGPSVPFVSGHEPSDRKVITDFIAAIPSEGRGPARSVFQTSAAETIARTIIEDGGSQLRGLLSETDVEELRSHVSRVSQYQSSRQSKKRGLDLLDEQDEWFEKCLVDAFSGNKQARLTVEFLRLEGLSAIRRASVASTLKVDDQTRAKLRKAIVPLWENAFSLNRALFDGAAESEPQRKQIAEGLSILSKKADSTVLELLSEQQVQQLAKLVNLIPREPPKALVPK